MKTKIFTFFTIFSCLFLYLNSLHSQVAYNPQIDSIVNLVSLQSISMLNRELTGDTSAMIGGSPYTIVSRYWQNSSNEKAAEYIFEKFQSFGLDTRYQKYNTDGANVIAKKEGIKYPNQQYILCGHYDDIPIGPIAPGADDNGSGMCAVIEAARVLSSFTFDYTLIFIAFDEQEKGLIGSKVYSDSAYANGDSILGVINLDMIAWDSNNDYNFQVTTDSNSIMLADDMVAASYYYQPNLVPHKYFGLYVSDQIRFWNKGFVAITPHEDTEDFNPNRYTVNDKFSNLNLHYYLSITKAAVGLFASLPYNYRIYFTHTPIENSFDTTAKTVETVINSPHQIAAGTNAPRLYYKINTGQFNSVNAFYNNLDTFKFSIPGQPPGTVVSYYIAAQDTAGNLVGTFPYGGKGFSPPGNIPPPNLFIYKIFILVLHNQCSNTLPKPILDGQMTYDTIYISQDGIIDDVNVNLTLEHTYDGDIMILINDPAGTQLILSHFYGGSGQNYTNTIFDDEASIPISQGTPPFTGSFIPEQPLSLFNGRTMKGDWILRIFDKKIGDQGTLLNWCLAIKYWTLISVMNNTFPVDYKLSQNYPNPFNAMTKIRYSLGRRSDVKIIIFDILGREISTLVNGNHTAGNYIAIFSSDYLSSGVYYYSMYVDGELLASKKMLLVK